MQEMVSSHPTKPRLAVSCWRGMVDKDVFAQAIQDFLIDHGLPSVVITGGAVGADCIAEAWARSHNIPVETLRPVYEHREDRSAPLRRNTDIVSRCTHLLAFPSAHGSGTQDAVRKARKMNKVVTVIELL
jgi:hypothetical protein